MKVDHCYQGDCRDVMRTLIAEGVRVQTCITSPPYFGLRDYGHAGQLGLEETPEQYIAAMVEVFRCVHDLLADDGTLWLNIGDSYAGYHGNKNASVPTSALNGWVNGTNENRRGDKRPQDIGLKPKDMIGIPWLLAFALRSDGWYLRQEVIWHKPNPAPDGRSAQSRFQRSHESVFLLSKSYRYAFNADAKRTSVWTVPVSRYRGAHFATFPPDLVEPCILAGSGPGDIVFDPFMGSGTVAAVAQRLGRRWLGSELSPEYIALQAERTRQPGLVLETSA